MYLSQREWPDVSPDVIWPPGNDSGKHCPDEAAIPRGSASSSSSPREDCEAPKYCVFCCQCPWTALTFVIIFPLCVLWILIQFGWLDGCPAFPTFRHRKQKDPLLPQSHSKAVRIRMWTQPIGCCCSWMSTEPVP